MVVVMAVDETFFHSILDKGLQQFTPAYRQVKPPKQPSDLVQSELAALKARLMVLESSIQKPSVHKVSNSLSLRSSLRASSTDIFLRDIERSEKEISKIEFNISRIGKQEYSAKQEQEQVSSELLELRRQHIELARERESLVKKVTHRTDYLARLKTMQGDFATLRRSYEKSTEIRVKQRELIEQLKSELKGLAELEKRRRRHLN
jgi:chromosome segregation ATPase